MPMWPRMKASAVYSFTEKNLTFEICICVLVSEEAKDVLLSVLGSLSKEGPDLCPGVIQEVIFILAQEFKQNQVGITSSLFVTK